MNSFKVLLSCRIFDQFEESSILLDLYMWILNACTKIISVSFLTNVLLPGKP